MMKPIRLVEPVFEKSVQEEIDAALARVAEGGKTQSSNELKALEEELASYLGVKHAVVCAHGFEALVLGLEALGLEQGFAKGDEIITPAFSSPLTSLAVVEAGYTPVMVDVEQENFSIHGDSIRAAIGEKTRAILPSHLFGQPANMHLVRTIAKGRRLAMVEDNAQSLGADVRVHRKWRKAGAFSSVASTSFHESMPWGVAGNGGAVYTDDDAIAEAVRATLGARTMEARDAALLRVKLHHLDAWAERRRENAMRYTTGLLYHPEAAIPPQDVYATHVFKSYTLRMVSRELRDLLRADLEKIGVETEVHYPSPVYTHESLRAFRGELERTLTADELCERVISLPIHAGLSAEDQERIVAQITATVDRYMNQ
ncbi:MAG: hypothetical protein CSA97_03345 [Bacteroidetes bacterium]|nr:MAG: hypothetical protein CSA97_03345 [Bacteroidota bacterium]